MMADWPQETTIAAFKRAWTLEGEAFWTTVFSMHQEKMQIKSPKVAVANLQKIFEATFRLANVERFSGDEFARSQSGNRDQHGRAVRIHRQQK